MKATQLEVTTICAETKILRINWTHRLTFRFEKRKVSVNSICFRNQPSGIWNLKLAPVNPRLKKYNSQKLLHNLTTVLQLLFTVIWNLG